ncbi:MAG: peptidoglycan DD-metalloendopeptidase family protein [Candidatus Neomarinimicrobiota bacterium]
MPSKKYTAILVSEDSETTRRFNVRRGTFQVVLVAVILVTALVVALVIYATPRILDYDRMKKRHQTLMAERMKVTTLIRDLNRIKEMNSRIEKVLGMNLELSYEQVSGESLIPNLSPRDNIDALVSYLDNIPSYTPVEGFVTQEFYRDPLSQLDDHLALDVAARSGTAIHAAASGLVVFSGWTYQSGNLVIMSHGDGYFTFYGHNQINLVRERQSAERGELIALVGDSGIATGPHLHFEIWKNGEPVDPKEIIAEYRTQSLMGESPGSS